MIFSEPIKTFEDLESLPVGSVLVTTKGTTHVLWKISDGMWSDGVVHELLTYTLEHFYGPMVAVWIPTELESIEGS